jgi:hypothetical protein
VKASDIQLAESGVGSSKVEVRNAVIWDVASYDYI